MVGVHVGGDEGVVSALEHDRGVAAHEVVRLDVEVAKPRVGLPATDELNEVAVDAFAE